jgi:hypothetical protein
VPIRSCPGSRLGDGSANQDGAKALTLADTLRDQLAEVQRNAAVRPRLSG